MLGMLLQQLDVALVLQILESYSQQASVSLLIPIGDFLRLGESTSAVLAKRVKFSESQILLVRLNLTFETSLVS